MRVSWYVHKPMSIKWKFLQILPKCEIIDVRFVNYNCERWLFYGTSEARIC